MLILVFRSILLHGLFTFTVGLATPLLDQQIVITTVLSPNLEIPLQLPLLLSLGRSTALLSKSGVSFIIVICFRGRRAFFNLFEGVRPNLVLQSKFLVLLWDNHHFVIVKVFIVPYVLPDRIVSSLGEDGGVSRSDGRNHLEKLLLKLGVNELTL